MIERHSIAGVILAGGRASRMMYQDKSLLPLAGKPLIDHIVNLALPQVAEVVISVNHHLQAYQYLAWPLVVDRVSPYGGPLVGIHSAMCWFAEQRQDPGYSHIACFPGDVPIFPADFVSKLALAITQTGAQVALCKTGDQLQPLFSLWSLATRPVLETAIAAGMYGPKLVLPSLQAVEVNFEMTTTLDFMNINTPEDLSAIARQLAETQPLVNQV